MNTRKFDLYYVYTAIDYVPFFVDEWFWGECGIYYHYVCSNSRNRFCSIIKYHFPNYFSVLHKVLNMQTKKKKKFEQFQGCHNVVCVCVFGLNFPAFNLPVRYRAFYFKIFVIFRNVKWILFAKCCFCALIFAWTPRKNGKEIFWKRESARTVYVCIYLILWLRARCLSY